MRKVLLLVTNKAAYGGVGLTPNIFSQWESYNSAQSGATLAHDLIEHGKNEQGKVFQELKAIGAALFVRDFGRADGSSFRDWARYAFPGSLNKDLMRDGDDEIGIAPKSVVPTAFREDFETFMDMVKAQLGATVEENPFRRPQAEYFLKRWDNVLAWVQFGFVNAVRRYKAKSPIATYEAIKQAYKEAFPDTDIFGSPNLKMGETYILEYGDGKARFYKRA